MAANGMSIEIPLRYIFLRRLFVGWLVIDHKNNFILFMYLWTWFKYSTESKYIKIVIPCRQLSLSVKVINTYICVRINNLNPSVANRKSYDTYRSGNIGQWVIDKIDLGITTYPLRSSDNWCAAKSLMISIITMIGSGRERTAIYRLWWVANTISRHCLATTRA
jgi:hypothetical protein